MSTRKNNDEQVNEIDLLELILTLKKKSLIIILTAFLFAITSFTTTYFLITPKFDSTTKIYVIAKENDNAITSNDLQTGALLTKDYAEMVKSAPVMEKVIDKLGLDCSNEVLANTITVETPSDTRVIKITVRNSNPGLARDIANEVREAANVQIKEVMNIDIINTVEKANLPTEKSTPNTTKNTLLGFIFGFVLSISFFTWMYLIDDTIKTTDDVEHYLGLTVLATIPLKKGVKKIKRVKGRRN